MLRPMLLATVYIKDKAYLMGKCCIESITLGSIIRKSIPTFMLRPVRLVTVAVALGGVGVCGPPLIAAVARFTPRGATRPLAPRPVAGVCRSAAAAAAFADGVRPASPACYAKIT